jgi:hypothetical protein
MPWYRSGRQSGPVDGQQWQKTYLQFIAFRMQFMWSFASENYRLRKTLPIDGNGFVMMLRFFVGSLTYLQSDRIRVEAGVSQGVNNIPFLPLLRDWE